MEFRPNWYKVSITFILGFMLFVFGAGGLSSCPGVGCGYQLGPILFGIIPAVVLYCIWSFLE